MERPITEKEVQQILNLGAFQYNAEMCAAVLDWPVETIEYCLKNTHSEFYQIYNRGFIRSQYLIDLKLFEQAQAGDLKSLEKLNARKEMRD